MSNIMVNELCNLQCPYCFANKYVNGDNSTDISYANFKKAVDWINEKELRNGRPWPENREAPRIGIIGGEPTLHENLEDLLMYAIRERLPGQDILIFTNALKIEEYIDFLAEHDISLLINLNSPKDIGENNYKRTIENIRKMRLKGIHISIGINFYKADLDTKFVLDVVKEFAFKELRVGLTSPNTKEKVENGSFAYFEEITDSVINLIEDAAELGCAVHFDCQKIPACFMKRHENRMFEIMKSVPIDVMDCANCTPVIDILPDLQIARCFGVSGRDITVPMEAFVREEDVISHFATKIDNVAMLTVKEEKCENCYERNTGKCQSGCIAFKMDNVKKLVKPAQQMKRV